MEKNESAELEGPGIAWLDVESSSNRGCNLGISREMASAPSQRLTRDKRD